MKLSDFLSHIYNSLQLVAIMVNSEVIYNGVRGCIPFDIECKDYIITEIFAKEDTLWVFIQSQKEDYIGVMESEKVCENFLDA